VLAERRLVEKEKFDVKVLLLRPDSPWLAKDGLDYLKRVDDGAKLREEFVIAHRAVTDWCVATNFPPPRFHRHWPCWRFVMTDESLFISTYVSIKQIKDQHVLRFSNTSPVYLSAKRHFKFVYTCWAARAGELAVYERQDVAPASSEISAGIVLTKVEHGTKKVLLEIKDEGVLAIPKGHVENNETPLQAAVRELREETGIAFVPDTPPAVVGLFQSIQTLPNEMAVKSILYFHCFTAEALENADIRKNAAWFDSSDLLGAQYAYDHVATVLKRVGM
jgi:ADP-ribose pyrophosphatase YjhB (NUDIX family)